MEDAFTRMARKRGMDPGKTIDENLENVPAVKIAELYIISVEAELKNLEAACERRMGLSI